MFKEIDDLIDDFRREFGRDETLELWIVRKIHEARRLERERCIKTVADSRTAGEVFGVSMIAENARWQALYDMQKADHSELDQDKK